MSSKPRPLKLRMPFPCAPEALELQFFEVLLLQCSQQAVFQASASEAADFLCWPQPVFFFGSAARVASELRSRGPSLKHSGRCGCIPSRRASPNASVPRSACRGAHWRMTAC